MQRQEMNSRSIMGLRNELEQAKAALAKTGMEIQEFKAANAEMHDLADQRSFDCQKVRNDLQEAVDRGKRITEEINRISMLIQKNTSETNKLADDNEMTARKGGDIAQNVKLLEQAMYEADKEKQALEAELAGLTSANDRVSIHY